MPILKWAGGKTKLLPQILPLLPDKIDTYYEPFLGGGAVFFALAEQNRFKQAIISDTNLDLVYLYRSIRDSFDALVAELRVLETCRLSATFYYQVRSWDTTNMSVLRRAARMLFLNRTCFNGLYRVNKKGEFNVPFGRYKNPTIVDLRALTKARRALENARITHADFEQLFSWPGSRPGQDDAVYFDPPYDPLSETSSFKAYTSGGFGRDDHRRLAKVTAECAERGATVVLSNSDTPFTRETFSHFDVRTVQAARAINSVGSKRGKVSELLVCTRPPEPIETREIQWSLDYIDPNDPWEDIQ